MKFGTFAVIVAAFAVNGCKNDTAGPENSRAPVLLEIEYVNYAWVPTFKGFFLDAQGDIYSYDREGAQWPDRDSQVLTEKQLLDKFSLKRELVQSVGGPAATSVAAKIALINQSQLSQPKTECADAGVLTYRAYTHGAIDGTYVPVLLRAEGDVARLNTSAAAQELIAYIRSLELITEMLGCDP